jgi:OFA family oxalate/formate antiporter-like MFS transporter
LGRINTFRFYFNRNLVFAGLIFTKNPMIFSVGVCIVLLNYGGAFGVFHLWLKILRSKIDGNNVWRCTNSLGSWRNFRPQITAYMKDNFAEAGLYSYKVALVLIALGICLSFL